MGCGNSLDTLIYSEAVSQKKPGETAIRRNPNSIKVLTSVAEDNCTTLQEVYQNAIKKFGNRQFLGTKTKDNVAKEADALGTAININNLAPELTEYKHFKLKLIGIFAKNREEWVVLDFANVMFNFTIIPFYDTLGPASISYILDNSRISTIVCSEQGCQTILKTEQLFNLKNLVVLDNISSELEQQLNQKGLKNYSWQQLLIQGQEELKKNPILKYPPVQPDDCYTFSYTSGTTGNPKGAMLSHKNLCAELGSIRYTSVSVSTDDVHISYLPLPHIYERLVLNIFIQGGGRVCFYGGDILKLKEDILIAQPTILFAVPRILNRFYEVINTQLSSQTGCKASLISSAINAKKENAKYAKYTHSLWDSLVFKKTKQALGGKVRVIVTASAPLSPKIQDFLKIIFCCPILDGYGQTESTGASFGSQISDPNSGQCGAPASAIEYKLVDVPEMQYTSEDLDEKKQALPRGEVCMRGPAIFLGYYKEEEKTKEAIDEDGWLHTGDIGQINLNGTLKIIDRKKNIFKLQQGEYVAPEKIENIYVRAKGVQEVFLHGDSLQTYCVAIVVPNQAVLETIAREKGINGSFEELCQNEQIKQIILDNMTQLGKSEGLLGFELAKVIFLEPKSLMIHGCLTSTMKIQRHICRELFKEQLKNMYKPEIVALIEKRK